ncbi:hypothetical protein BDR26DRAFT_426951 [Obelidium mucronatum]|nr:hypothetical protein BDR26DRAFT_426951 [Obelidium mucronatum]
MASKFQQSLRVKEQQQAIIEARLVSPPGASALQQHNLGPPLQQQQQQQQPQQFRPIHPAPPPLARLNMPKHPQLHQTPDGGYYSQPHSAVEPQSHQHYRPPPNGSAPNTSIPSSAPYDRKFPLPPPSPSAPHGPPHGAFPPPPTSANPYNQPPNIAARRAFVSLFESVYDTASEDLPKLVATLKDQMRKSSSLLQTLQASGQMIEGLVRSCFRDMQLQYGEKFGAALNDLNRRLEVLEAAAVANNSSAPSAALNPIASNDSAEAATENTASAGPSSDSNVGEANNVDKSSTISASAGPGPRKVDYSNSGFRGEPMTPAFKTSNTTTAESQEMTAMLKVLMDRIEQLEKKQ